MTSMTISTLYRFFAIGGTFCAVLALLPTPIALAASFQGLGGFGGSIEEVGYDVSDDGTVVVGTSGNQAAGSVFRWTRDTGMVNLGYHPVGFRVYTSGDGSVVVGSTRLSMGRDYVVRWTQQTGPVQFTFPSFATDVSGDGRTILLGFGGVSRWTAETGNAPIPELQGGNDYGEGISADGSVVVGTVFKPAVGNNPGFHVPYRWSESEGLQEFGVPPGTFDGFAQGVSADGSVVFGGNFRWTLQTGMQSLGPRGYARGMSGDERHVGGGVAPPVSQHRRRVGRPARLAGRPGCADRGRRGHDRVVPEGRVRRVLRRVRDRRDGYQPRRKRRGLDGRNPGTLDGRSPARSRRVVTPAADTVSLTNAGWHYLEPHRLHACPSAPLLSPSGP